MSTAIDEKKLNDFIAKSKKIEKGHQLDLSSDEDLSIAIMNLISIEEHLFFTAQKTGVASYYDLLFEIREMRKELMKQIIKEYDGEVWCISKHLLASSMRLMEVGTKAMATKPQTAQRFFEQSYQLFNLFWALNLKLIGKKEAKELSGAQKKTLGKIAAENKVEENIETTPTDLETSSSTAGKNPIWKKLGTALNKALDCCRE